MLPDGRGGHANICGKGEGAEARDSWRRVARSFCPVSNPPPHGCEVEAMAELMTVRLAELVNAIVETYRLDLCL